MSFIETIKKRAISEKKTIVLPESTDRRVLEAASEVLKENISEIIIVGEKEQILRDSQGFDISGAKIISPNDPEYSNDFAETFYQMRKEKGISKEQAISTMQNPLYFGVMLVKKGFADGMVAGAINSTSNTLRPALQILKTAPGAKIVSGFFVMVVPECDYGDKGAFIFADSGLIENPSIEELSEIAISSAKSFSNLVGAEPKVGMLSYSSCGSAKSDMTEKVIAATKLAKEKAPDIKIDGELQVDAAIVPSVAASKAPGSVVAGEANVLVFPDLNCGNIAYKLVQRLAKAEAYGPITQGLAKPVNDLSRGCIVDDIVGVVAITAVQAQNS